MPTTPPSTLSIAILCQLLESPRSGYRLIQTFERTPMGHFSTSLGAVYPALKRMERAGWIRGRSGAESRGRARCDYRMTRAGRAVLQEWASLPPTREDIMWRMDLMMLRFVFMGKLHGRSVTRSFLQDLIVLFEGYLRELREHESRIGPGPVEAGLALRHGIECYQTHARWARGALKKLSPSSPT